MEWKITSKWQCYWSRGSWFCMTSHRWIASTSPELSNLSAQNGASTIKHVAKYGDWTIKIQDLTNHWTSSREIWQETSGNLGFTRQIGPFWPNRFPHFWEVRKTSMDFSVWLQLFAQLNTMNIGIFWQESFESRTLALALPERFKGQ